MYCVIYKYCCSVYMIVTKYGSTNCAGTMILNHIINIQQSADIYTKYEHKCFHAVYKGFVSVTACFEVLCVAYIYRTMCCSQYFMFLLLFCGIALNTVPRTNLHILHCSQWFMPYSTHRVCCFVVALLETQQERSFHI